MNTFNTNELIEVVLYNKHRIKSFIKYIKLLRKIKKISPSYSTLETIYEFIEQLNYAYFHRLDLDKNNNLFIGDSRGKNKKDNGKSLIYKDNSVTILFILKPDNYITLHITREMGYKETSITFKDGDAGDFINNELHEQLLINCTDLLMDSLYRTIKKYRHFRRMK